MKKLMLTLDENLMLALERLAVREYRNPWQQAVLIINRELEKEGLFQAETLTAPSVTTVTNKEKGRVSHGK